MIIELGSKPAAWNI